MRYYSVKYTIDKGYTDFEREVHITAMSAEDALFFFHTNAKTQGLNVVVKFMRALDPKIDWISSHSQYVLE